MIRKRYIFFLPIEGLWLQIHWNMQNAVSSPSAKCSSLLCPTAGSCGILGAAVCAVYFVSSFEVTWGCVRKHTSLPISKGRVEWNQGWIESAFLHQTPLLKLVGQLNDMGLPSDRLGVGQVAPSCWWLKEIE